MKKRSKVLQEFKQNPEVKVIIMSLMAANGGLNITATNNVIFLDPWWNLTVEDQAIDRCHRIGQRRPVKMYKLFVANTIEDRVINLQDFKRGLAKETLGKSAKTPEDNFMTEFQKKKGHQAFNKFDLDFVLASSDDENENECSENE